MHGLAAEILWVLLSTLFLAVGIFIAGSNWAYIYLSWRYKRFFSPVPLLGALFLGLGLAGFSATRPFWWLCFALDWGTLSLIIALPFIFRDLWRTSRINRLHQFSSQENGRETIVSLYRNGHALVLTNFDESHRHPTRGGPLSTSTVCKWHDYELGYELVDWVYEDRVLRLKPVGDEFLCEDLVALNRENSTGKLNGATMRRR